MLKVYEYSHLGGSEILQVRYPAINAAIDNVIAAVRVDTRTKVSREKTNAGEQLVYDIERLRKHFPAVPVKVILIDVELPVAERVARDRRLALREEAEGYEDQEE